MEYDFSRTAWFALKGENSDSFPDFEEQLEDQDEDEDDDDMRGFIELVKERCPNCLSPCFDNPYTTKEGLQTIHCKGCDSLLCPKCLGLLDPSYVTSDGQKARQCQKCKTILLPEV
jgi:hypothetical protein